MDYTSSILVVTVLFLLGVISPGPNFLAVVHQSLNNGFKRGVMAGLGVALGDMIYATIGLFGMVSLIDSLGSLFILVKLLGGAYLIYLGIKMIFGKKLGTGDSDFKHKTSLINAFRIGLFTDLSNPKTVVFFTSIFASTIQPEMPKSVLLWMLISIGLTSVIWRMGLSFFFSRNLLRSLFQRFQKWIEGVFGSFLVLFGLKLVADSIFKNK